MRLSRLAAFALMLMPVVGLAQRPEQLPDIDVLYIERTPRYPGYALDYDRPGQQGVPILVDNRTRRPLPVAQAKAVKRWPAPGETVTFTAHVQNRGSVAAPPWDYEWLIDGRPAAPGRLAGPQDVGKEATAKLQWRWQPGRHTVRFVADPLYKVRDLSLNNNSREDATDAWSLLWAVDRATYESFGRVRNFLGTRSFEDWAQWHVDHMNHLFDISASGLRPTPAWRPRVRCDGVVVVDSTDGVWDRVLGKGMAPLDAGYDGAWAFGRRDDCAEWAANVDWGLIHEWGHQLGLTDLYALDRPGFLNEVADRAGDPLLIGRLAPLSGTMMHGHGPTTFSPECMAALQSQQGRRRGYYGDHYYAVPAANLLRILDALGRPVAGARVAFWQDRDGRYAGAPTFAGTTNAVGLFALPNRPAPHIVTDHGFTQHDNPFGKINVVGPGDVFFIRVQARGQTDYTWLDITELNLACWSGRRDRAVYTRRTHIPPPGAPPAPRDLTAETDRDTVRLRWQPVAGARSYQVWHAAPDEYVFRPDGAPVAGTRFETTLPGGALHRFAVTASGPGGLSSAFSDTAGAMHFVKPWGLVVLKDGRRLIRDAAYGQAVLQKPDGNTVGLVGSVHYHFEGSYDIALDGAGRILSAKWPDGYDAKPGFRVQGPDLQLVVDYRQPEGGAPGQVRQPMGIGANSAGHIFVADTGNDRVQEFTPEGKLVQVIGQGELGAPMKVAFDRQDRLYVADSINNRIAVYERQPGGAYGLQRSLSGPIKEPVSVLVDDRGRVFVSTTRMAGVYMAEPDGRWTWKYVGSPGEPLTAPRGLAFDGKGNLLIVDEATRRVLTVRLP